MGLCFCSPKKMQKKAQIPKGLWVKKCNNENPNRNYKETLCVQRREGRRQRLAHSLFFSVTLNKN